MGVSRASAAFLALVIGAMLVAASVAAQTATGTSGSPAVQTATSTGTTGTTTGGQPLLTQPSVAEKAPDKAVELQLEWEKAEIERDRHQLEERKFNERDPQWERLFSSPGVAALITSLLAIVMYWLFTKPLEEKKLRDAVDTAVLGYVSKLEELESQRDRLWDEVVIARSTWLLEKRADAYKALWGKLEALSLYPLPFDFKYSDAAGVQEALKEWYFGGGGMYLTLGDKASPRSRERYFALQRALVKLAKVTPANDPEMIPNGATVSAEDVEKDEAEADKFLGDEGTLPDDGFRRYRIIRALGSRLRSAIVEDLGTRGDLATKSLAKPS